VSRAVVGGAVVARAVVARAVVARAVASCAAVVSGMSSARQVHDLQPCASVTSTDVEPVLQLHGRKVEQTALPLVVGGAIVALTFLHLQARHPRFIFITGRSVVFSLDALRPHFLAHFCSLMMAHDLVVVATAGRVVRWVVLATAVVALTVVVGATVVALTVVVGTTVVALAVVVGATVVALAVRRQLGIAST